MNKKTMALLLALSILPTLSMANYEPDANTWQWYESTPRIGYFMSKQSPVVKLSETADTLVLRGYVQTVFATPIKGTKYSLHNIRVTYNKQTGERHSQEISLYDYDENRNLLRHVNNLPVLDVEPGTLGWRMSEALLKTYNAQIGK